LEMRVLVVFTVLASLALAAFARSDIRSPEFDAHLFTKFLKYHGKSYASVAEKARRFAIFQSHLDLIDQHNLEADQGKHSFKLGLTPFADMTNTEYRQAFHGLARSDSRSPAPDFHDRPSTRQLRQLPAVVDWRTKGVVTAVKNQGSCGSCWSFSATGSMEGAHALATKNLISLSEQELVDCVNGGADNCQVGGEMYQAFEYVISTGGEELESAYPYSGTSGNTCRFDKGQVVATFSSYANVTSGDESALQSAVAQQPVSIAIDASSIWFQLYSSGVYDDSSCKNDYADLDHGVLAVGYGHDSSSNKDYWVVKNSWGAFWGQAGYIYMVRNKNNQCGVATDASYPIA